VGLYLKLSQSCVSCCMRLSRCSWQWAQRELRFSFITVPVVLWECYVFIWAKTRGTHHNPCKQTHAFPTVRVRYHVPVADGEEGNRDEPHGSQEVTGHFLFVMIPEVTKISRSGIDTVSETAHSYLNVSMLENDVVLCEPNGVVSGGGGGGEVRGGVCYTCFVKPVWHYNIHTEWKNEGEVDGFERDTIIPVPRWLWVISTCDSLM